MDETVIPVQAVTRRRSRSGVPPPKEREYPPGYSGCPGGKRGTAGAYVREWFNVMATGRMARIKAVPKDPTASTAKKAAARQWIDATSGERSAAGVPISGQAVDRIADRTEGKPLQRSEATQTLAIV